MSAKPGVRPPEEPKRSENGTFAKGTSGNPGGFPKDVAAAQKLLREKNLPAALKRIGELLDSENEVVALGAAKLVIDYTVPKPKQEVGVSGELKTGDAAAGLTGEDLLTFLQALKARRA